MFAMLLVHTHYPSGEVFWHEYAKIRRHTSQNSTTIAAGNLNDGLRYCERTVNSNVCDCERYYVTRLTSKS